MLFQIIPEKFFSILSTGNKKLYWECIYKLFTIMSNQLSFGVKREDITDELIYYFDSEMSMEIAGDEDAAENSFRDSRDKANFIIRRLADCGWITIETDNNHEQKVYFLDYSIEILRTLVSITKHERIEYQGYIYTIYNLLRGSNENPGIALQQIYENTDKLITGLKNLNSNIKKYIDELTRHATVKEIMDALFNDYMLNVVDKAYHRLLTSDNVAKFRPEIISRLEGKKTDTRYIERASKEIAEITEMPLEEAKEKVYDYLRDIRDAFLNMDNILEEIYRRSTQYQKSAVNRARFLLSTSEDVQGQIKEILLYLNEEIEEMELDLGSIYQYDFIDNLISVYTSGVMDEASFYVPPVSKGVFLPEEMQDHIIDADARRKKFEAMQEKLRNVISVQSISDYVSKALGDKPVIDAASLPLLANEDVLRLIYIRLYGQRRRMGYSVKVKDKVLVNGFTFRNFEIWKA
ncbi:MAG: DUF5716 family protein [Eubacteriales bacterium]|nr:DUF5716 family protein [Eubacteriales bacterium]